MPTLFRFFVVLLILAGLFGAGVVYLGNFVEPRPRDMIVKIPSNRLDPKPVVAAPEMPATPAAEALPADAATGTTTPAEPEATADQ